MISSPEHKIPTAERLCRQEDDQCRLTLVNFEPLLRDALAFLGVGQPVIVEEIAGGMMPGANHTLAGERSMGLLVTGAVGSAGVGGEAPDLCHSG